MFTCRQAQLKQQVDELQTECARLGAELHEALAAVARSEGSVAALQGEKGRLQAEHSTMVQQVEHLSRQVQSSAALSDQTLRVAVDARKVAEQELAIAQNNSQDSSAQLGAARKDAQR